MDSVQTSHGLPGELAPSLGEQASISRRTSVDLALDVVGDPRALLRHWLPWVAQQVDRSSSGKLRALRRNIFDVSGPSEPEDMSLPKLS